MEPGRIRPIRPGSLFGPAAVLDSRATRKVAPRIEAGR